MEKLKAFLSIERKSHVVWPQQNKVFRAFECTQPNKVKVVIVGQDPYYMSNTADGLAFSSQKPGYMPASLEVLLNEVYNDMKAPFIKADIGTCDLSPWADQGVFLINRILTVRQDKANSHKGKGWETLTDQVISILSKDFRPKVFMLWGNEAQKVEKFIDPTKHLLLKAPHPASELYGRKDKGKFTGCEHFSKANLFLREKGIIPVNWILS